mgnify:CR=1 FL=1
MKTVYMVFNNKEKISVSAVMYSNLKAVFQNFIKIKTCFLDEIEPEDIADGDLFIVLYPDRVYNMHNYISSLDKVIVVTRTIQKKYMPELFSIPENTSVLVVNDSDESTLNTANNLYALGLNHLNLIPYLQNEDNEDIYRTCKIAITPNEALMVPRYISKVINIMDRYIALDTFAAIISKLNINNEIITRNLIKYTDLIAGTDQGENNKYVTEHLKSEMLKKIIHSSSEAIIIIDCENKIVYYNDKAGTLFCFSGCEGMRIDKILDSNFASLLQTEEISGKLVKYNGTNYIVNKSPVKIVDRTVGYSLILNDEKDIKNMGNDLSKQLVKNGLVAQYHFSDILCKSAKMERTISLAKKVALTDYTVLITGESGTGKELVAQSIHNYSKRSGHPFVAINCAALPESLLESELFGYEKGAFTGAIGNGKLGLFEQASSGTVFLDEIGDMPLKLQAHLLRVLQEKQIMRLGSDKVIDVDIRIIAATNKDLVQMVREQNFREDLYFRLCNIPIAIPPLRSRKDDIPVLFSSFSHSSSVSLTKKELAMLTEYDWPGNVRELQHAAEYFDTLGELPPDIAAGRGAGMSDPAADQNPDSAADIEAAVLQIIRSRSSSKSGIGRTSIIYLLRSEGIMISDSKMRALLGSLEQRGMITIGKGRAGCICR